MFRPVLIPIFKGCCSLMRYSQQKVPQALRSKKAKSNTKNVQHFVDMRLVRALGGKGGDGCISFLQLWSNENAGPDGGDGGNGGHIIFQATNDVKDLSHVDGLIEAEAGEKGFNKDCNGKNAQHTIIKVPIGTIIRNGSGTVVADLNKEKLMFIASRGGAGGKGNHFFISDVNQSPDIAEYGAGGEDLEYMLEIRGMAHVGLIGFPNAGKSTLLRAISRARPKVAPYPFTTLQPYIGMIQYDDYEQIAVADLPGLIPNSHKNRGLGIQFLKHAERCTALLYILDMSIDEPWEQLETLQYELSQFNPELVKRPQLIIANKVDLSESEDNLEELQKRTAIPVIAISAKYGTNVTDLLNEIRILYDNNIVKNSDSVKNSSAEADVT